VSCRGASEQIAPAREPDRARRLAQLFSIVDLIHCVSEDMAETVRGFGAADEKILVNRPAVDTASWTGVGRVDGAERGTEAAPLRVLSVSRLHWKKGLDDAVRAVAAARAAGLHVQYRIAGDGPEREKLLYLRQSLGLDDEVELVGWKDQSQVRELLGWADVFLLPSLSEGISNSALEAMAAGVPVVSTRCGGMHEAITAADEGLLVDVGSPQQLADALGSLRSAEQRATIARGGQGRAITAFDLTRQADVFHDAYRALLATR
jgi:colanic acid/amylovoran biosynthesis glycosyltransferase